MPEGLVIGLLVMAVLLGVGSAAFLVMRSPGFWIDAARQIGRELLPKVTQIITKPMPPEQLKAWQDCQRRGGKWNHFKKRCE